MNDPVVDNLDLGTPVSRRSSTLLSLGFQYVSFSLIIVRGIVLIPLSARFVDHDLLGAWYASGNVLSWLMLSEGGAWLLLRQQSAQKFGNSDRAGLAEVIGAGGILMVFLGTAIAGVSFALAPFIPRLFHVQNKAEASQLALSFALAGLGTAMSLPACIPRAVQHGLQRVLAVNTALALGEAAGLTATIVLMFRGFGVLSLALGILVREAVHNVVNWPIFLQTLRRLKLMPKLSGTRVRALSGLMGWTFLNNVGSTLRQNVDAIIIAQFLGNSVVLQTEWSKRIWDVLSAIGLKGSAAFTPAMAHLHGEGDLPKFRALGTDLLKMTAIAAAGTLALGLAFNRMFMGVWTGGKFYAGFSYNLLLGFATVLAMLTFTVCEVLFAASNIRGPAIIQFVQSLIRIVSLVVFVRWVGTLSVPLSMLTASILGGSISLITLWKQTLQLSRFELTDQFKAIIRPLTIAVIADLCWSFVPRAYLWPSLFGHSMVFGAGFVVLLYCFDPFVQGGFQLFGRTLFKIVRGS
jgi:O-antigen/teichoic acid export membrane protein